MKIIGFIKRLVTLACLFLGLASVLVTAYAFTTEIFFGIKNDAAFFKWAFVACILTFSVAAGRELFLVVYDWKKIQWWKRIVLIPIYFIGCGITSALVVIATFVVLKSNVENLVVTAAITIVPILCILYGIYQKRKDEAEMQNLRSGIFPS